MTVMSRTEIDRMSVLRDLAAGRIKVADASTLMGLGRRQVFRLAEQPLLSGNFAHRSDWYHQGAVFGLRSDAGGGQAGRAAPHSPGAPADLCKDRRDDTCPDCRNRFRPIVEV
jgi:hypothetical protein